MKSNIAKIQQEWQAMLSSNTMPLFEIELKGGEYLLCDLELFPELEEIRFCFDSLNLKTWFSGNVKQYHDCKFAVSIDEYCSGLDELLELIHSEIMEGFIVPNDLLSRE